MECYGAGYPEGYPAEIAAKIIYCFKGFVFF